jgi:hypothetical protein
MYLPGHFRVPKRTINLSMENQSLGRVPERSSDDSFDFWSLLGAKNRKADSDFHVNRDLAGCARSR